MTHTFNYEHFQNGSIQFTVYAKPVSLQNKTSKKLALTNIINETTKKSEYIITDTCWVSIDYYCSHIQRLKNPGAYDIDNIVKPILDSLVGLDGLIIDDAIVDRVTVNWVDTPTDDHIVVNIEYPMLMFFKKTDLVLIKSKSGWCFPTSSLVYDNATSLIESYFQRWDSIKTEDEYHKNLPLLPSQQFINQNKIKEHGYKIIDL